MLCAAIDDNDLSFCPSPSTDWPLIMEELLCPPQSNFHFGEGTIKYSLNAQETNSPAVTRWMWNWRICSIWKESHPSFRSFTIHENFLVRLISTELFTIFFILINLSLPWFAHHHHPPPPTTSLTTKQRNHKNNERVARSSTRRRIEQKDHAHERQRLRVLGGDRRRLPVRLQRDHGAHNRRTRQFRDQVRETCDWPSDWRWRRWRRRNATDNREQQVGASVKSSGARQGEELLRSKEPLADQSDICEFCQFPRPPLIIIISITLALIDHPFHHPLGWFPSK